MAQQYTTDSGSILIVPGTVVNTQVKGGASSAGIGGVLTLIGEADEGPDFTKESDISETGFTPDQLNAVIQKYGSGRLVDAFKGTVAASNDGEIVGSAQLIHLIKTNKSVAASLEVSRSGFGPYATVEALREGTPSNLIKYRSEVFAYEQEPQAKDLLYIPAYDAAKTFKLRSNGADQNSITITAKMLGEDAVAAMSDVTLGILAKGGLTKLPLSGLGGTATLSAAVTSGNLQVTLQSGFIFSVAPEAGDTVVIPAASDFGAAQDSCIKGAALVNNEGSYVVVQATNTASNASMVLKKLAGPAGATIGSASGTIDAGEKDIIIIKSISIFNKTGMDRQSTVGTLGTFTCATNDGVQVVLNCPAFAAQPVFGDTVKFVSAFAGITAGFYQVTSSDEDTVTMVRLSNGTSGATGSSVVATAITASTQPFIVLKPTIDGAAKTLEVDGNVEAIFKDKNTHLGANISNKVLVSGAEQKMKITVAKGTQGQSFTVGGDVIVKLSCKKQNSWVEFSATKASFYSNSVLAFEASFKQFKIANDLVEFINQHKDFSAKLGNAKFASFPTAEIDKGIFTIAAANLNNFTGLVKADAYSFKTLLAGSTLVKVAMQSSGLPEITSPDQFLSGGIKGGSTSADFIAAIDACEGVDTNLMITLVSQDADKDIFESETESSSTYVLEAINAYLNAHQIKMSAEKARKNRLAVGSVLGTFDECKDAASNIASFRLALAFQPVKTFSSDGAIKMFQPWMTACKAAGMTAAAGYKGIVKKFCQISGIGQVVGFNPAVRGDLEDALKSGLLCLEKVPTGGFRWVSDQTTYSVDNNFVFNSIQAVSVSDLMALTLIARFDRAVVGKSVADISAAAGYSILETEMFNFFRLKWITSSDDAPKGYKNAFVKVVGGVLSVSFEAKLAGLIYFVPISMSLSQVEQTASQQ